MQIEELKKNMSALEQTLAKTNNDIKIDIPASETAQNKILRRYRQGFVSSAILAVVFTMSWLGDGIFQQIQSYQRGFLAVYLTIAALWYLFLYIRLKQINVSRLAPLDLFIKSTRLKIYTYTGEAVAAIGLAVFFSLFLPDLFSVSPFAFWMCVVTLVVGITSSALYYLPKYIKLYNELNSIER